MSDQILNPTDFDRDVATRRIAKSLSRLKMRGVLELAVRDENGATPVCVTLPGDLVGDVEARVEAMGGAANVVIAYSDSFAILSWTRIDSEDSDDVDVHEAITMAMFKTWLDTCDGETSMNVVRRGTRESVQVPEMAYAF